MNKVIDTSTRIFMAIVGPSGSGKTKLILKFLMGNTFYPKFGTVLYLYKEMQPAFSEKVSSREVNVEFMKFDGFESVRKLENVLLVFDDSCEDIYNDKEFVRLATAGRHRGIDVIYVKHNLFQQSRWSRTIDLNTSVQIASRRSATRSIRKTIECIQIFEKLLRISYQRLFWTSSNRLGPPYIRLFEILFKYHTTWANSFLFTLI